MGRNLIVLDRETGEMLEGVTIITQEQAEARRNYTKGQQKRDNQQHFTAGFMGNLSELVSDLVSDGLTNSDYKTLGRMLLLITYTNFETNVLMNSTGKQAQPLTISHVYKLLGLIDDNKHREQRKSLNDFISRYNLISKGEAGELVVNPNLFKKGKATAAEFVKVYSNTIREGYKEAKADDLGLMLMLLPFMSRKNLLAKNPNEADHNLELLTIEELSELLCISVNTFSRRLERLELLGMPFLTRIGYGRNINLMVNPLVFYRQDGKPSKDFIEVFRVLEQNRRHKAGKGKAKN